MNKIKAIEMTLEGFPLEEICNVTKVKAIEVVNLFKEFKKTGIVTIESRSNNWERPQNLSKYISFMGIEFESIGQFAKYMSENYGLSYAMVKSRMNKGATPEECLLPEDEYRKRKK